MFVIMQYPFIDFRLLLHHYPNKDDAFFPNLKNNYYFNNNYYRYLGALNDRKNQDGIPFSEHKYYNSKAFTFKIEGLSGKIVFQRMYNDGLFFHYDIGLYFDDRHLGNNFLQSMFNSVSIKCKLSDETFSFLDLQKFLCIHYQYGTYKKRFLDNTEINSNNHFIYFGKPAIFIESNGGINFFKNKKVLKGDINISYSDIQISKRSISIWNITKGEKAKKEELRRLRICLSKIHCIREGMVNCFSYLEQLEDYYDINITKIGYQFNEVLKYIDDKVLVRNSGTILRMAFQYDNQINGIIWDDFIEKAIYYSSAFEDIQKVKKMGEALVEKGFNMSISNSNIINKSPNASITTKSTTTSNDIDAIFSLLTAIKPKLESLDIDKNEKEDLQDDIDVIHEELTKETPKQTRLKKAVANIESFVSKASGGALLASGLITHLNELVEKVGPFIDKVKLLV